MVGIVGVNPQTFLWKEGDSLDVRQRQTLKSMGYYRRALLRRRDLAQGDRGVSSTFVKSARSSSPEAGGGCLTGAARGRARRPTSGEACGRSSRAGRTCTSCSARTTRAWTRWRSRQARS